VVDRPARLEDYALLGDCHTAALVSREGSIDWWCVPRFDGPACFAALLGTSDHGRFLIAPSGPAQSSRRYRPHTMVLETEHDTESGRVRVVDALIMHRARPLLVRIVQGIAGEVEMRMELVVRFDYGSIVPWVRRVDGAWRAIAGPDGLELYTPVEMKGKNLRTTAEFTVRRRDRAPRVVDPADPRHDRAVVEGHDQLHLHLDFAREPLDDPDEQRPLPPRHEAVDDPHPAGVGVVLGLEHHRVGEVPAARLRRARRCDQEATVLGRAEQRGEAGRFVEARNAPPVDRALARHQGCGVTVAQQGVILEARGSVDHPADATAGPDDRSSVEHG